MKWRREWSGLDGTEGDGRDCLSAGDYHWQVKRTERLELWKAIEQSEAEARVAELEAVLEEAEIEVAVAAQRLHFEDIALATDRADELAELSERLRAALKGNHADD